MHRPPSDKWKYLCNGLVPSRWQALIIPMLTLYGVTRPQWVNITNIGKGESRYNTVDIAYSTANTRMEHRSDLELIRGPFYQNGLTLITAWISNYMSSKVWDEITYPFPNFNGVNVEVWEWIFNFITTFVMAIITYPCWGLRLIHFSKRPPWTSWERLSNVIFANNN